MPTISQNIKGNPTLTSTSPTDTKTKTTTTQPSHDLAYLPRFIQSYIQTQPATNYQNTTMGDFGDFIKTMLEDPTENTTDQNNNFSTFLNNKYDTQPQQDLIAVQDIQLPNQVSPSSTASSPFLPNNNFAQQQAYNIFQFDQQKAGQVNLQPQTQRQLNFYLPQQPDQQQQAYNTFQFDQQKAGQVKLQPQTQRQLSFYLPQQQQETFCLLPQTNNSFLQPQENSLCFTNEQTLQMQQLQNSLPASILQSLPQANLPLQNTLDMFEQDQTIDVKTSKEYQKLSATNQYLLSLSKTQQAKIENLEQLLFAKQELAKKEKKHLVEKFDKQTQTDKIAVNPVNVIQFASDNNLQKQERLKLNLQNNQQTLDIKRPRINSDETIPSKSIKQKTIENTQNSKEKKNIKTIVIDEMNFIDEIKNPQAKIDAKFFDFENVPADVYNNIELIRTKVRSGLKESYIPISYSLVFLPKYLIPVDHIDLIIKEEKIKELIDNIEIIPCFSNLKSFVCKTPTYDQAVKFSFISFYKKTKDCMVFSQQWFDQDYQFLMRDNTSIHVCFYDHENLQELDYQMPENEFHAVYNLSVDQKLNMPLMPENNPDYKKHCYKRKISTATDVGVYREHYREKIKERSIAAMKKLFNKKYNDLQNAAQLNANTENKFANIDQAAIMQEKTLMLKIKAISQQK